jgi:hypothetical protein
VATFWDPNGQDHLGFIQFKMKSIGVNLWAMRDTEKTRSQQLKKKKKSKQFAIQTETQT